MPRTPLTRTGQLIYHVSARTNNKEWFKLELHLVWDVFCSYLAKLSKDYGVEIVAFVLMSNHYHLLIRTPDENLPEAMNYLQREVSKQIGQRTNRTNHLFGGRYKSSLLETDAHAFNCYKYVYRNPIAQGLERSVGNYPFSTLNYVLRGKKPPFPLHDDIALMHSQIPVDLTEREAWLNNPYSERQARAIKLGLKHAQFKVPKGNGWITVYKELSS